MAAMGETLKAKTKKELRSLAAAFKKRAKQQTFTMQLDYDPARIKQTKDGFEIYMRAHS